MKRRHLKAATEARPGWSKFFLVATAAASLLLPALFAPPAVAVAECPTGQNRIVCENEKPGSPWQEWDVQGAGDSSIQGFATDISVNVGERIDFKVDTDAADYTIDIYRTGWYQGLGARKITTVSPSSSLPQIQPECLSDVSTELTDCGTWAVSGSWDVPSDAVSGVYLAKLTRTDNGDASHITFIVRDESSTSDVLVQTSDPTWHAYNLYGGSDFYSGGDNGRAYKISYNRPFATRAGIEARDFYFGAEYPLVRFLERNGYDVSYFSGVDTDRHGDLLKNHNVFLSVGHDEYWSGAQRENVEAARESGVNLQFLSGNEVYWRTRYEPSSTGGNDYRTLTSYKETWSNTKIDPSEQWTGTWRDPRFADTDAGAGLPENALTGTAYVVNSGDMPVTVNEQEGKMRLWRDTALASQQPGGKTELAPHTVGYESNEDLPNGFRPPGLIHLSTTTGDVPEYLQDFGNQVAPGTTTHHSTLYKADSGALVFSAGSIQWTWGLDQWHDGDGAPEDARMQQAQVNLLADMDAQPQTLIDGLVIPTAPKDTTAPTVHIDSAPTSPVKYGELVTVEGTANDGQGLVAAVEYSFDGGITWTQAEGTTSWSFTAAQRGTGETDLLVRAIDDSANYPSEATAVPYEVSGPYSAFGETQPAMPDSEDGSSVELGLRFTAATDGYITGARFYKSAANTGTHTGTLWSLNGVELATATFTNESSQGWQSAEFDQPVEAQAGDEFVVSYFAPQGRYAMALQDFAYRGIDESPVKVAGGFGTPSAGLYNSGAGFPTSSWDRSNYFVDAIFETGESIELSAYGQSPAPTAVSVPLNTTVGAMLSKQIDAGSVKIVLQDGENGTAVTGSTDYNPATRRAIFTPDARLAEGTDYTATISASDLTGNPVVRGASWSFRTVMPVPSDPNECPCGLYNDAVVPAVPAVNDGVPVTLGTRFSATIDGVLSGLEFYRSPGETGPHTGWLYSTAGDVIAEVTFPDISATGWQYAEFDTPVPIVADTEYVAAYRSNGTYPVTPAGLGEPLQVGPLRTSETSGHYSYASEYPASRVSTSYLVDVRFQPESLPVTATITERSPAAGSTDAAVDTGIVATFSEGLEPGAYLQVSTGQGTVTGSVTSSNAGKTLTFTPDEPLPAATVVTVAPKNIIGSESGEATIAPWTFRTVGDIQGLRTFLGEQQPGQLNPGDNAAVELGVKLTTQKDIKVHALRYFQGPQGLGEHTGSIWDSSGNLLATAAYADASEPGWQIVYLDAPIELQANSEFTVSYHAPAGGYVFTPADFANGKTDGVLGLAGTNGLFSYGPSDIPSSSWNNSNYFADLVYTVTDDSSSPEPTEPTEPTVPTDPAGVPMDIADRSPAAAASNVELDSKISVTFNQELAAGAGLDVTTDDGAIAGSVAASNGGKTLTFTPTQVLPSGTIIRVGPKNIAGVGTEAAIIDPWSFRTVEPVPVDPSACPCGLQGNAVVPAIATIHDGVPVTLGTRFAATTPGELLGLEFYRSTGETGPHIGWLYSTTGAIMAEVQFPDLGVSGWQYAAFAAPVPIEANNDYVAAYRSNGTYPATPGGLGVPLHAGPLYTSESAGHFTYAEEYPATTVSTSYLVDVRFQPAREPVSITSRIPSAGAADVSVDSTVEATFSETPKPGATLKVTAGEDTVAGTSSMGNGNKTVLFTPDSPLPEATVFTVTAQNVEGTDGGVGTFAPWTFKTTGASNEHSSFLGLDTQPTELDPADNAAVELGMRMVADQDFHVHAIRYYQGPLGTGSRKGSIWDSSGSLLASTTFDAATEPGWQTSYLSNPLEILAGTEFTVSYHAPSGGYVHTPADFAQGKSTAQLRLEGSNGVFSYGPSSMPTGSWNSSNYFVDLVYAARDESAAAGTSTLQETAAPNPEIPTGQLDSSQPAATRDQSQKSPAATKEENTDGAENNKESPEETAATKLPKSRPPSSTETPEEDSKSPSPLP